MVEESSRVVAHPAGDYVLPAVIRLGKFIKIPTDTVCRSRGVQFLLEMAADVFTVTHLQHQSITLRQRVAVEPMHGRTWFRLAIAVTTSRTIQH